MKAHSLIQNLMRRSNKNLYQTFADEHGLVYFGSVDQHDDEHHIIRGMTVSHTHTDAHYCIGTYESYDIAFVERTDAVTHPKQPKRSSKHMWHIIQVELHTNIELPHVFIGLHSHSESFYAQLFTKYTHLRPISLGAIYRHIPQFTSQYRVFASPAKHLEVEHLLTSTVTETYVQNFGALAVEIVDGYVYVYSEKMQPTSHLLDAMIKNATWLAGHIDDIAKTL